MLRAIWMTIFSLGLLNATAQLSPKYIFHHLGVKEGLLANEVHAITQDSKGFIWIGSKGGLQRFDGSRFLNFTHREGDTTSIPHNNIIRLRIDQKDRLWLITSNHILGYFDVNKFVFHRVNFRFNNTIIGKPFGDFYSDENNEVLLLLKKNNENAAYGVATYDEGKNVFATGDKRFHLPDGWFPFFLSIDSVKRCYWFGTNNGLIKYDPQTGNFNYRGHNPDKDSIITALQNYREVGFPLLDTKGNFWMTTFPDNKSVYLIFYDGNKHTVTDRSKELGGILPWYYEIHNISIDSEGDTWFNGLNMLVHLNDQNIFEALPIHTSNEYNIRFNDSFTFNQDREKNIWIATDKGVFWFNPAATLFHSINLLRYNSDIQYNSEVTDITQLQDGHIIVTTWGSGIFEYDRNFEPVNSPIVNQGIEKSEGLVWSVLQRANGDVWRANQDGWLIIYHANSNTTSSSQPAVFNKKTIRQLVEDKKGNIWLGTHGGALVKWVASTEHFQLVKKFRSPIWRLYADNQGDIWVISDRVEKINPTNNSVMEKFIIGGADGIHLPSSDLRDIIQYNDSIYVIAGEQVSIWNSRTRHFTYLNNSTGLPSDYVSNLVVTKKHDLWMATENGIYFKNFLKNVNAAYVGESWLADNDFEPGASCLLTDGRIIFGTNHNFVVFDPAKFKAQNINAPGVAITAIKLYNKSLPLDSLLKLKRIELTYLENSLTFEFATLTYQSRQAVAYKMQGIDKHWNTIRTSDQAVYSYLPPGNYIFYAGSPDASGDIKNILSLNIHITAPFWRTIEFYAAIVLLAGFISWRFYKGRKKRWQELLQMRNNLGRDLQREVRTTLKNISVLSEIAAMKAENNPEQAKDYIREINQKSRRSVIAMDDVMWSIDPANDSIRKIIERIYEIAEILNNEYETIIDIEIDNSVMRYKLSMKERLEFMMIYKRAILLLSREGHAKHISLVFEKENNQLSLILFASETELPRFDPKVAQSIEEIKSRAASINSMAEVQTDSSGTIIIVKLKHKK